MNLAMPDITYSPMLVSRTCVLVNQETGLLVSTVQPTELLNVIPAITDMIYSPIHVRSKSSI